MLLFYLLMITTLHHALSINGQTTEQKTMENKEEKSASSGKQKPNIVFIVAEDLVSVLRVLWNYYTSRQEVVEYFGNK